MFAGNFTRRKGIDRVVDVARAMPDVSFSAVGWGGGFEEFECPGNLEIVEARGEAYKRALAQAAILFLPSRAETFGLVIYEGMQAGCSIVSTIPGNYAGLAISDWSTDLAVRAIRTRIDAPDLVKTEGVDNRKRVARLTWETSTSSLLDLYKRMDIAAC